MELMFSEAQKQFGKKEDRTLLVYLEKAMHGLILKNEQIHQLYQQQEQLKRKVSFNLFDRYTNKKGQQLDFTKVKNIVWEAFNINLILEPAYFDEITRLTRLGRCRGFHLTQSPFNFIKATNDQKELEQVIKHENFHGLVDNEVLGVKLHDPFAAVKRQVDRYEQAVSDLKKAVNKDDRMKAKGEIFMSRANLLKYSAQALLDESKEEILATVESIENTSLNNEEKTLLKTGNTFEVFVHHTFSGTAAHRIERIVNLLQIKTKTIQDQELKTFCLSLGKDLKRAFVQMGINIQNTIATSQRISKEALLRSHILMLILNPSQYRHLQPYLEYKYGKAVVARELALAQALKNPLQLPSIKSLRQFGSQLTYFERKVLLDDLKQFNPDDIIDMKQNIGIASLTDLRSFLKNWRLTLAQIGAKQLPQIEQKLIDHFMFQAIFNDVEHNFANLLTVYRELTPVEKASFQNQLTQYVTDNLPEELESVYPNLTEEQKRNLPLWSNLRQLGVKV